MLRKRFGRTFVPATAGQPYIPASGSCVPVRPPPPPVMPPGTPPQPTPPPSSGPLGPPAWPHVHSGTVVVGSVYIGNGTCLHGAMWSCCGQWATTPARWEVRSCQP